jgi:hypothetical protein
VDKNSDCCPLHISGSSVRRQRFGEARANGPLVVNALHLWCDSVQHLPNRFITWAYMRNGTSLILRDSLLRSADTSPLPAIVLPSRHQQALWSNGPGICGSSQRPEILHGAMNRSHGGKLACKNSARVVDWSPRADSSDPMGCTADGGLQRHRIAFCTFAKPETCRSRCLLSLSSISSFCLHLA